MSSMNINVKSSNFHVFFLASYAKFVKMLPILNYRSQR